MKRCPTCNRTYSDETLSFCLADGALLSASEDPQATLTLPSSQDPQETLRIPASQIPQVTQPSPSAPKTTALELRNITKRFGDVLANDHVTISVMPGTIHAIVGENGAGKSTAMRIAYGFYTADSGDIIVDGEVRDIKTPHDAIALGIGMVHQHFMLVEPMTVAENIVLGAEPGSVAGLDLKKAAAEIRALSNEFKLSVDPNATIESLSVGQQQRVELMKALYRRARLLILDEPTAVLTPQEVEEFFAILRNMREQGKTIIIITHKLSEVLAISDDVTVMRDGRVVGELKTKDTNAAELARLMVGREVLLRVEKSEAKPGDVVLSVRDFSVTARDGSRRVDKVSFDVQRGEIVGIAGVEGNGQTELIEALAGLVDPARVSGRVEYLARDITNANARTRKEQGIAHVPEDRHRRGLLLDFNLAENSILGIHYRRPAVAGLGGILLNDSGIQKRAAQVIKDFDVRPPNPELPARALSGGNQQKLIIGREFELEPKLLLVSQPTRGVDIGAIEFIHRKLVSLRDAGCAVLLVSAELEEVTALADRLLIIHEGRIVGEVDPKQATTEEIGLLMTGGKG
ncbi:MAG: heme ABC transporter ATP-binding protein [Acidobacteria bacterium]|nr:MAG: heme ABC transporter ATP-binding protein [Acidobacteriota bacterium]